MTAIANWVKQTVSGTPGTGTITLGAASTNFMAIGAAFPHDMVLEYMIEDGGDREHGLGTYTHSGTTLARTRVIETLVSGAYDATAPTALTLTSSAIVYLAKGGSMLFAPSRLPEESEPDISYFANIGEIDATSSGGITTDRLVYQPVFLANVENIEALFVVVATVNSATKSRMGLYGMGTDGKPDNLLVESGDATPAVDVLPHTFTAQAFQPGWYYCACVFDNASVLLEWTPASMASWSFGPSSISDGGTTEIRGYYEALGGSWTTLPATATPLVGTNFRNIMGFRRV